MDKNPEVLAMAGRNALAKKARVAELGITPDISEEAIDEMVVNLATAKAIEENLPKKEFVKGQRWYVMSLIKFSGMTGQERLDHEYQECFVKTANEADLASALDD